MLIMAGLAGTCARRCFRSTQRCGTQECCPRSIVLTISEETSSHVSATELSSTLPSVAACLSMWAILSLSRSPTQRRHRAHASPSGLGSPVRRCAALLHVLHSRDVYVDALVSPRTPLTEAGLYWGYEVRVADSLAQVFSESSYEGGYDVTVGTSERGQDVEKALDDFPQFQCVLSRAAVASGAHEPRCRHLLIALGPLAGLELCVASDPKIPLGAEEASDLFDFWLNVISGQGSRTVRTEVRSSRHQFGVVTS